MPAVITIASLSAAHQRQIQALRRPVLDAARSFGAVRERLADLAPKVVKAYDTIKAEHTGFQFVQFARMFDATIPTHGDDRDGVAGYKNHRTYYTLNYMRRVVTLAATGRRGQQGVRDSATDALSRTIATILQIVDDQERIWTAIQSEFGFADRLMTRLRKRVAATKPLITLETTRPAKLGKVIHMERAAVAPAAAPATETEPMRQPGRSVVLPARTRAKKAA